jgi:hypothetical protein
VNAKSILDLENENERLKEKLTESKKELETMVMNETEEKRLIQIKQEKVCVENKNLNDDIVSFKKEFDRLVEKT